VPLERVVEFRIVGNVDLLPELIYFIGKTGAAMFEDRPEKLPRPRDPAILQQAKRLGEVLGQLSAYLQPKTVPLPLSSLEEQTSQALEKLESAAKEVSYYARLMDELKAKLAISRELSSFKALRPPATEAVDVFIALAGRSAKEVAELCKSFNAAVVQQGNVFMITVERKFALQLKSALERLGVQLFTFKGLEEIEPQEALEDKLRLAERGLREVLERHREVLDYAHTLREALALVIDVFNRSAIDEGAEMGRLFASYEAEMKRLEAQLSDLHKIRKVLGALSGGVKIPEGFRLFIDPETPVNAPHVIQEVDGVKVALVKGEAKGVEVPAEYLLDVENGKRVVEEAIKSTEAALQRVKREREALEKLYSEYSVYGDKKWDEHKDMASLIFYVLERDVKKVDDALVEFVRKNSAKLDIVKRVRYKYIDRVPAERRPTLEKYPAPIKQFTKIVYMYGVPKPIEISPVPLVALIFPVFFGWMYGDLGHGFLLFLLGTLLLTKLYGGRHRDWGVIWTIMGLVSMFFGAFVYQEAFGFPLEKFGIHLPSAPILPLFGHETLVEVDGVKASLAAAFLLGFLLIFLAFLSKVLNTVLKGEGDVALAIVLPQLLFFFSIGMVFFSLIWQPMGMYYLEPLIGLPWGYLALLSIVWSAIGVVVIRARYRHYEEAPPVAEEFIMGIVEGAFGALANIPSFSRLVILVMIHGVLTKLVNGVAIGLGAPGILFAVFGHALIAAGEGLFSLVQSLRLVFYEVLSKFYEGRGRLFQPLVLP